MTLLERLAALYPSASRTTLREMLRAGRVRVNGAVAPPGAARRAVDASAEGRVSDHAPARAPKVSRLPFEIVHDDADLLLVNKPAGLITSSGPRDRRPTLIGLLRAAFEGAGSRVKVGLVHRLDADASGLIVFSKHNAAHAALKAQFARHDVERAYAALVEGIPDPPEGRIRSRLVEWSDGRVRVAARGAPGEEAVSHYQTIASDGARSLLHVVLETGRKHQIRVHLASRRCPIVNDPVYNRRPPAGELRLRAVALGLTHPGTGQPIRWELPQPTDWIGIESPVALPPREAVSSPLRSARRAGEPPVHPPA
jgi:23S rRNA pseudouridine1911/1915/1917 synthase